MPIKVNADIVDLRTDKPKAEDTFFVDSNVWYWLCYTKASQTSKFNQSTAYPNYLNLALASDCKLYKSPLSFPELAHSIERTEREIFNAAKALPTIKTKDFRNNYPAERLSIVTEIENAWSLVEIISGGLTVEFNLTSAVVTSAIDRIKNETLDGYDLFMIDSILSHGIDKVITDDSDFGQIAGITVFTANDLLVREAKTQKKFVKR